MHRVSTCKNITLHYLIGRTTEICGRIRQFFRIPKSGKYLNNLTIFKHFAVIIQGIAVKLMELYSDTTYIKQRNR